MNQDKFDGQWKIISGRIQRLWAENLGDYDEAIKGNLQEVAGILQKEFGLAKEDAAAAIARWRNEYQPAAVLQEQWNRFQDVMQDRWQSFKEQGDEIGATLELKRALAIRDAEALIEALKDRYHLSEENAARQLNDWLGLARTWLEHKVDTRERNKEGE